MSLKKVLDELVVVLYINHIYTSLQKTAIINKTFPTSLTLKFMLQQHTAGESNVYKTVCPSGGKIFSRC